MNLYKLKIIIDATVGDLSDYQKLTEVPVLITLSERSVGQRSSSEVDFAGMGFDWENNQFRIEPSKKLVTIGNNFTDILPCVCRPFKGKNYYFCNRCESKIAKNDNFCKYCGQKLK